jgi:hypothetical protein
VQNLDAAYHVSSAVPSNRFYTKHLILFTLGMLHSGGRGKR